MRYIVFSGAPTRGALSNMLDTQPYRWETLKTTVELSDAGQFLDVADEAEQSSTRPLPLPPDDLVRALSNLHDRTVELSGASISLGARSDVDDEYSLSRDTSGDSSGDLSFNEPGGFLPVDDSAISWPPTNPREAPGNTVSKRRSEVGSGSCLTPDESQPNPERTSFLTDISRSLDRSAGSYDASITVFPDFAFNPALVVSLSSLPAPGTTTQPPGKLNILAGVLEVTGPETIPTKTGPVSLLQLVLGDGSGPVARLAVWRETAEQWAPPAVRRGDVVHFSNLTITAQGGLTASPRQNPSMQLCYRVLPVVSEDARFRPDLRLAQTDTAVRQVAAVVRWVEHMAGLA
ncbi:hypothetical protein AURDEDRAFT_169867 [Auricularia subglabra TFB-10046 SS5]|nr:hypothetical protein AURDEDRAFT_169867 [Auricularia subglabra TFB-10046 SS5]